ncbi:MAG: geranylgeranylglycerol-phosphate geranylgeranyltransferase [Cyclobacteriaceae bacterium]|nr:geranylgeranylglycerol-phosphate geranylgeranyltransferase [Cyclobacteriaceae bacterium]MDW8330974.1 geranylgeranylglycerol-phosphate geranylgeranyltransferase [Cyclobacteriaceae bacterium]
MPVQSQSSIIEALLRLTRTANVIILVLAQYAAAFFLLKKQIFTDWRLFVFSASAALIAAGGYVINDYYDVKIDLINNPNRVVIGRTVPRRVAILIHALLSGLGIFLGLFLGWKILAINIFSVGLLWWYSAALKRLPFVGNLAVALLTGLSIAALNALYNSTDALVFIYAFFAFFITLIREIIKDMEDLKGDGTYGCKTLPIIWGIRKTKTLLIILIGLLGVTVTITNFIFHRLDFIYLVMLLLIPLAWLISRLVVADTKKDFGWLSSFCKVIILLGILSMALI